MVIVSAITNVFFSLIVIITTVVELFFVWIGILDTVGIFLMGILNIIYACMRLYALRVQQRLIENNQVTYYNYENALVGHPVVECRHLSPVVNLLLEPFRF